MNWIAAPLMMKTIRLSLIQIETFKLTLLHSIIWYFLYLKKKIRLCFMQNLKIMPKIFISSDSASIPSELWSQFLFPCVLPTILNEHNEFSEIFFFGLFFFFRTPFSFIFLFILIDFFFPLNYQRRKNKQGRGTRKYKKGFLTWECIKWFLKLSDQQIE